MLVRLLLHSQANDMLLSFIDRTFYVSISVHPRVHFFVLTVMEDIYLIIHVTSVTYALTLTPISFLISVGLISRTVATMWYRTGE